jgi:hypothetical protein
VYCLNLEESSAARHGTYVLFFWKIRFYSENTENVNTHFISSIFKKNDISYEYNTNMSKYFEKAKIKVVLTLKII